jgi:hypothetical protein
MCSAVSTSERSVVFGHVWHTLVRLALSNTGASPFHVNHDGDAIHYVWSVTQVSAPSHCRGKHRAQTQKAYIPLYIEIQILYSIAGAQEVPLPLPVPRSWRQAFSDLLFGS